MKNCTPGLGTKTLLLRVAQFQLLTEKSDDDPSLQETAERIFDVLCGTLLCAALSVAHKWKKQKVNLFNVDKEGDLDRKI